MGCHEGFDELALVDADEVAGFSFVIPDADVAQALESGTEAAFGATGAFGYTAETSRAAAEKTYDAVGFAEWIALKNDGLGFVDWHRLSARRLGLPFFDGGSGSRDTFSLRIGVNWNENFYHTRGRGANDNAGGAGFWGRNIFGEHRIDCGWLKTFCGWLECGFAATG